ncbi:hemopexin repeat-containing protein [Streptomyces spiramyceticus]|uniref:hemopexin repeat-containing protein n=1 Tax=Streptomyces spiramyceticus TaxID=299717 RepID=UPI00237C31AD|nr:hemopexin repeat-containing protein [Streptomyces spiramyceticus]
MPKSHTTSAERLDNLRATLSGARADTRASRRMRLSRGSNLLTGVLLHAAARLDEDLELTDLEQRLVNSLRRVLPDEEIAAWGREYKEQVAARGSVDLFPAAIADLPVKTGFALADLVAAVPGLAEEILAQPNVAVIDVSQPPGPDGYDTQEFTTAQAEYGTAVTILTGPPLPQELRAAPIPARLRLSRFRCERQATDSIFNPANEIYWVTSAGSDTGAKTTYDSGVFNDIYTGSQRTFDGDAYLFNGSVRHNLTWHIQCWEQDDSDTAFYRDLRKGLEDIAEYCIDAAVQLTEDGDDDAEGGAGLGALIALAAALLAWLVGLITNQDDMVRERTYGMDKRALYALLNQPGREDWWSFDGGANGRHKLWIQWAATKGGQVHAAVRRNATHTYLFHGDQVVKYNTSTERLDQGPLPISDAFRALRGTPFARPTTAVELPKIPAPWVTKGLITDTGTADDRICLFSGADCLIYRIDSNRIEAGPLPMSQLFPAAKLWIFAFVPEAVCRINNDEVYLFWGEHYRRYNQANDTIGGETSIAAGWPGLAAASVPPHVIAAVQKDAGRYYFFQGTRYVRYRASGEAVEAKHSILDGWPGLKNTDW